MSYQTTPAAATSDSGPLLCTDVDLNQINYSDIMSGKSASFKSAYINYKGNKLMLQTPWLKTWDGICEPAEEYRQPGAPPKYALNFSLKGPNEADVVDFQKFLHTFDEKIIADTCNTHCQAWFRKPSMSKEVCEVIYHRQLKLAKDKETNAPTDKFPASFKVKVPFYDGVWKCELYNDQQQEVVGNLSEHLTGRCEVRAILRCSAVWFAGGKMGVSWQAHQLEYQFRRTAEDEPVGRTTTTTAQQPVAAGAHKDLVDGSDEEEEVIDSDVE
jgi:hypothetical protein